MYRENHVNSSAFIVLLPANEAMHIPWSGIQRYRLTVFWNNRIVGIELENASQEAISHGFLSVHPVVPSVSLPPNRALPKLFPTVSCPFTLPSLLCPTVSCRYTPSSLPSHSFPPQAISHDFPSVTQSPLPSRSPRDKVTTTRTQASDMLLGKNQSKEKA